MARTKEEELQRARLFVSLFSPLLFVTLMAAVMFYQWLSGHELYDYGIEPGTLEGLRGILLSPFIHKDWEHFFSNAIPMILLGTASIYFYRNVAYKMFFIIWLADGLGVWIFGRYSYHIGASGLVYGLASFLFISGLLRRNKGLLSLSFVVALLYGGLVWGILPQLVHLSWESHLFGLVSGMILAVVFRNQGPGNDPLPDWYNEEDTEDSENSTSGSNEHPSEENVQTPSSQGQTRIVYHFKDKDQAQQ